ncbi:MAG: phosphotransferase [Egibacteraceae bacterium]
MAAPSRSLSQSKVLAGLRLLSTPPAWLAAAVDPNRVQAELASAVPEFASGALTLWSCEPERLRLKDDSGCWTCAYEATVSTPAGELRSVSLAGTLHPPGRPEPAHASGRFSAAGWQCSLPALGLFLYTRPADAELPAVGLLTDAEKARVMLERSIRESAPAYADLRISSCTPRVMRHKPGSRCTVAYTLRYPPEAARRGWPELVVAKAYHEDKGHNAYAAMRALWDSPLSAGDVAAIAEPLAYLESDRVLVQGPVAEEQTLKELLQAALSERTETTAEALTWALRQSGAGLAALHRCGVDYGEPVTLDDELAEVREIAERLAAPIPAVAEAAIPLLTLVEKLAAGCPPDPLAPSHRSFRPAQVLLAAGRIAFIDFDGFCQAEPALDVALFRTTIKAIGLGTPLEDEAARRTRLAQLDTLCDIFTDAYTDHASVSSERVALWETLDLLTNLLNSWAKIKLGRLEGTLLALEARVERLLD